MFWIDSHFVWSSSHLFTCDWLKGGSSQVHKDLRSHSGGNINDWTVLSSDWSPIVSWPFFFCPNVLILQEDILLHDLFPFSDICRTRRVKIYGDGLDECQQPSLSLFGGFYDHCNDAEEDVFKTFSFFLRKVFSGLLDCLPTGLLDQHTSGRVDDHDLFMMRMVVMFEDTWWL